MKTRKKKSLKDLAGFTILISLLILLFTATACEGPFNLSTVLGLEMGVLDLTPTNVSIASSDTQIFTVSGGTGPFVWSIYSGPGSMSAGTTASETFDPGGLTGLTKIKVTDSEGFFGTATVTINNIDPLLLFTGTQKLYPEESTQLYATGGYGNYTYSIVTNSSGVNLNTSTGAYIAGATPGLDVLRVTDELSATQDVTIEVINPATNIPDINYIVNNINTLPASAQVGAAFTAELKHENIGNIGGGNVVQWTAFISTTNNMNGIISLVDSGTVPALSAHSVLTVPQVISGIWPSTPGTYYIVVHLSADIDVNTLNNFGASGAVTVDVPDVDYRPGSVIPLGGPIVVGSLSSELFSIENFGSDNGTQIINWTAWLSTDATPGNTGDINVDSGTAGPFNTGVESGNISVDINWNIPPADYNLIITWFASDDILSANDSLTSTAKYIVRYADIDYEANTSPAGGGSPIINSSIADFFVIENTGSEDGTQPVNWAVWLSTDGILNIGDTQIDSGTIGPLASGFTSGAILINGSWSDTPGNSYIIVTWTASDDNDSNNDSDVSAAANVRLPIYDYSIINVPPPDIVPTYIAGDAVTGSFTVQNLGGDDDATEGFSWAVYASSDTSFSIDDALIESRSDGAAQLAMDTPLVVNYNGFWPDIGGDYYIIVVIESTFDPVTANNENFDAVGTSVVNLTDYEITGVNYHPLGIPGGALNTAPTPWSNPVYIPYDFTITEIGGRDGNKKVDYTVYASTDTLLDGSDYEIKKTFIQANDIVIGGGTITEPFDDANPWPAFPTAYYIIITINAADDVNAANDRYVVGPVEVAAYGTDSDGNDSSGPFAAPELPPNTMELTPALPTGVLHIDEHIRVDGVMEINNGYDTYRFKAGPVMTTVYLELTWLSGGDAANMYLWDETNSFVDMEDTIADSEGPYTVSPIVPGEYIYIGVKCLAGNAGTDYTLRIRGRP